MHGNAILMGDHPYEGEKQSGLIHSLKHNAKECGLKDPKIYRGRLEDGWWAAIWMSDNPPDWLKDPQEWRNDRWE